MTRRFLLLALVSSLGVSSTLAGPVGGAGYNTARVGPDNANCQRQDYRLAISSSNIQFKNVDSFAKMDVLAGLMQTFISSEANFTEQYETGDKLQIDDTYTLSGTLCTPKQGAKSPDHVQLLVHGVGFDSSYWDFSVPEDYSYVRAAADQGFATFRYDRLGTGLSQKPVDAYNIVQSPTDLAILTKFAQMLRNGDIGGMKFSKIVGVGHSYGSAQLQALTATAPNAIDAVLLQGFSHNGTAMPSFLAGGAYTTATLVFPDRFPTSELSSAYLVTGTPYADQYNFFYYPYFSNVSFIQARETEQPATQGVLFTQGSIGGTANNFTGPVHVVTGAQDYPFCFRNCYAVPAGSKYPTIPGFVKDLYPAVNDFSTYIPANTGHAVNQHYSAPDVYQEMLQFVARVLG